MSWSKITNKCKKPFGWWYYKILCEIGYEIRKLDYCKMYYRNLNKCCKYGFNLYGEPFKDPSLP